MFELYQFVIFIVNLKISKLKTYFVRSKIVLLLLFGVRCARPEVSENTLSVQRPQPHTTNPWKEKKEKTVGDKKRKSRSCQQESIGSALETCQSHTIKHRVTKIVPKRHRDGHKASAILRSSTRGGANECIWGTSDAKQKKIFFLKHSLKNKRFLMSFFKHLLFNARKIHLKYFGVRIYIIYCKFCNIQHKFTGHRL